MNKRDLFSELDQGIDEIKQYQDDKLTLRTSNVQEHEKITISPKRIKEIRKKFNMSQAVFSRVMRISKRTLEKWEQGETKPNEQATALMLLARNKPEIIDDLAKL